MTGCFLGFMSRAKMGRAGTLYTIGCVGNALVHDSIRRPVLDQESNRRKSR